MMAGVCFELKAKNGQVYLYDDQSVVIGRAGWFGRLYQLLNHGRIKFSAADVRRITLKEPSVTRGYLRFELGDAQAGKSVVWLTDRDMTQGARQVKQWIEEIQSGGKAALPEGHPGTKGG